MSLLILALVPLFFIDFYFVLDSLPSNKRKTVRRFLPAYISTMSTTDSKRAPSVTHEGGEEALKRHEDGVEGPTSKYVRDANRV